MAKKEIKSVIKLQVVAGEANPAPPVGPALSQHGLNIMDFCKAFNEKSANQKGTPLPVLINVYADRSFDFHIKQPPVSFLIRKSLNLQKGSSSSHLNKVGKLTGTQLEEIAKMKMSDLNANDLDAAKKIVAGTARSMGIETEL